MLAVSGCCVHRSFRGTKLTEPIWRKRRSRSCDRLFGLSILTGAAAAALVGLLLTDPSYFWPTNPDRKRPLGPYLAIVGLSWYRALGSIRSQDLLVKPWENR